MLIRVHVHQNSAMYEQQQLHKTEGNSSNDVIQPTPPSEVAATRESAYTLDNCYPKKVCLWHCNCDTNTMYGF